MSTLRQRNTENVLLTIIFIVIIYYIVTFIVSLFKDTKPGVTMPTIDINISRFMPNLDVNTDYLLDKFTIKVDSNVTNNKVAKTINKKDFNKTKTDELSLTHNIIIDNKKELELKDKNNTNSILEKHNIEEPTSIDINTSSKEIKIEIKKTNPIKKEILIKKKVEKKASKPQSLITQLRVYINDIKTSITDKIDILDKSYENKSYVKIRITVLRSGKYQNVIYLKGNKELLAKTRNAIRDTFPRIQNKVIKEQFPRYIRLDINFKTQ